MDEAFISADVRPYGIAELVRRSSLRTPDAIALVFAQRAWTYVELWSAVTAAAGELTALGVGPGDRVAALGRNSDRYLIAFLATQLIGAVHVPINFMLSAREVAFIVGHSQARLGFADPALLDTLRAAVAGTECEPRELTLPADDAPPPPPVGIAGETVAQIAYTSGTESSPKGAMLSHGGQQAQYVSCIAACEFAATDVYVQSLPLYHCAQMHVFMLPALALGATSVLLDGPDPTAVTAAIAEHAGTSLFAPPTVWISLLGHSDFTAETVGTLRKGYFGAASMPVHVIRRLAERLPQLRLWNLYGQTEIGPVATYLPPEDQLRLAGSVGRPVLNVSTRVVDEEMRDVAAGEVGEVVHRSVQVMLGYFRDPERSAAATVGGWFHSGDLATRDAEGNITIVDRKKDMINTGGENVSSLEVEEVLFEHPAVAEAAVVAVPDDHWIEAVCAVIVRRPGEQVDAETIRGFARARLAGYKTPKRVVFLDALPKNPSGKILKRELRATLAAQLTTDGADRS